MRRRVVVIGLIALAAAAGYAAFAIHSALKGLPDAYAKWDAGEILIDHLRHHDNRWPAGWDDLRPAYDRLAAANRLRGGLTFSELQSRLRIDWNANLEEAVKGVRQFRAVEVVSGSRMTWEGKDPNEIVMDYLQRSNTAPPASGAAR